MTLGEALANNQPNDLSKLDEFCTIVKSSLREELPLALQSENWFSRVCHQPVKQRIEIASLGLSETVKEMDLFKSLMEKESLLGIISIRIPRQKLESDDLWVKLRSLPTDDNDADEEGNEKTNLSQRTFLTNIHRDGDHLAAQPVDIFDENKYIASPPPQSICWHPIYNRRAQLGAIASQLHLVAPEHTSNCQQLSNIKSNLAEMAHAYIEANIGSETEFAITNGRSKLVRLPKGRYRYTIQKHPQTYEHWQLPKSSTLTEGTISWEQKRPRVTIKTIH